MYTPGMSDFTTLLLKNTNEIKNKRTQKFFSGRRSAREQTRLRVWSRVPFVSPYFVLVRQSKAAAFNSSILLMVSLCCFPTQCSEFLTTKCWIFICYAICALLLPSVLLEIEQKECELGLCRVQDVCNKMTKGMSGGGNKGNPYSKPGGRLGPGSRLPRWKTQQSQPHTHTHTQFIHMQTHHSLSPSDALKCRRNVRHGS
jgi:hypothetical protein